MIYELIQPNHIYNSEKDLDNDLDKWIQEESICFNIKISQQELHNIEDKIERNCIRASLLFFSVFHFFFFSCMSVFISLRKSICKEISLITKVMQEAKS